MYLKKRRYDIEMPEDVVFTDEQSKAHLQANINPTEGVWVERVEQTLNSTMGSGGVDLHAWRKQRRWERNEEWYVAQESRKEEEQAIYDLHKQKINEILDKKTDKNRLKRLKKQKAKQQAKLNAKAKQGEAENDKSGSDDESVKSPPEEPNQQVESNVETPSIHNHENN